MCDTKIYCVINHTLLENFPIMCDNHTLLENITHLYHTLLSHKIFA